MFRIKKEAMEYFSEEVLQISASLFNVSFDSLKELAGFENIIYSGSIHERDVVIRFSHSSHRNEEQIEAIYQENI
ncbi:hypothetical protein QA612_19530 [Evansella sp. AB-P1]|uniref:hypothetical protein n=1 Tax=Evansella sp. AB-P1 TaxID=3037653 RepID=UPI00241EE59F|nr:hypothetical protein [Evansella sp. AB-P1]MDG5789652.1 hypothetical protein [Evansella sp. AB-P1]